MTFGKLIGRSVDIRAFFGSWTQYLDILVQALFHRRFDVLDDLHFPAEILGVTHGPELNVSSLEKTDADAVALPPRSHFVAEGHRRTGEPVLPIDGRQRFQRLVEPPAALLPILLRMAHLRAAEDTR